MDSATLDLYLSEGEFTEDPDVVLVKVRTSMSIYNRNDAPYIRAYMHMCEYCVMA